MDSSGLTQWIDELANGHRGVRLLNRSTRSVTLTDHGRQYYERTKALLDEMTQADSELMSSTVELSGLVRIASSSTFGRLHVLQLLPQLLTLHPKLRLDLKLTDGVQDLLAEGIDLAIRVGPVHSPDAVVKRVTNTSLVCGIPPLFRAAWDAEDTRRLGRPQLPHLQRIENWTFNRPRSKFSVRVSGSLLSNTVETILLAAVPLPSRTGTDLPTHLVRQRMQHLCSARADHTVAEALVGPGIACDWPFPMKRSHHGRVLVDLHRPYRQGEPYTAGVVVHEQAGRAVRRHHKPAANEVVARRREIGNGDLASMREETQSINSARCDGPSSTGRTVSDA